MPVTSPAESSAPQRSNRTVPKVPTSQPASMSSDSAAPRTPIKGMTRSWI
jgi:translation initiation factor 4G